MSHPSQAIAPPAEGPIAAAPQYRWWASPRLISLAALLVAAAAAAVAIVAWIQPNAWHSYSGAQSEQSKANVCAAWVPVHQSIWKGTPNPRPGDPVAQLSVAANVRLAELGGGSYLKGVLAEEPATPSDLRNAVSSVATTLQHIGLNYLAGNETQAVLAPLLSQLDPQGAAVDKLCK